MGRAGTQEGGEERKPLALDYSKLSNLLLPTPTLPLFLALSGVALRRGVEKGVGKCG